MRKFNLTLTAALFCGMLCSALFVSCKKDDKNNDNGDEVLERVLYSELDLPEDGSNGSKYGISDEYIATRAEELGVEANALKAVWKVDTGGRGGFLPSGKPMILFQGHIFWQQLRTRGINPQNHVKGNEDILYQRIDKTKYVGGEGEWDRLERGIEINEDAALSSASWGMSQIMGFNYVKCGCASVQEFVSKMKESEESQFELFAKFLTSEANMLEALKKKDWKTFARLYFGPTYAQDRYDDKLSKAYSSFSTQ